MTDNYLRMCPREDFSAETSQHFRGDIFPGIAFAWVYLYIPRTGTSYCQQSKFSITSPLYRISPGVSFHRPLAPPCSYLGNHATGIMAGRYLPDIVRSPCPRSQWLQLVWNGNKIFFVNKCIVGYSRAITSLSCCSVVFYDLLDLRYWPSYKPQWIVFAGYSLRRPLGVRRCWTTCSILKNHIKKNQGYLW